MAAPPAALGSEPLPDYYGILGLEPTCTAKDVRNAWRKKALKLHPDHNKGPNAGACVRS